MKVSSISAYLVTVTVTKDPRVFEPFQEIADKSNIKRFMSNNAIADYKELIKRSTDNIEWYWDAINKDLEIEWFKPYAKVLDMPSCSCRSCCYRYAASGKGRICCNLRGAEGWL